MGGPLSVTLADIHLIRTENDAVKPFKPVFYKQYDDDIYIIVVICYKSYYKKRKNRNCSL